jgi:hypothetical protein
MYNKKLDIKNFTKNSWDKIFKSSRKPLIFYIYSYNLTIRVFGLEREKHDLLLV